MTPRSAQRYTIDANGCWVWGGYTSRKGYGWVRHNGVAGPAHRAFYETHVGPIDGDLVLDHLCRNRQCVNPEHLEPVTNHVNVLRGEGLSAVNARKTHCKQGHEFNSTNTIECVGGHRKCRTCQRQYAREWVRRKRAAARAQETAA